MSRYSWVLGAVIFASLYLAFASHLPSHQKHPTSAELKYTRAHSLGSAYTFDPRDGWQTVNISNLAYKYNRPRSPNFRRTAKTGTPYPPHGTVTHKVKTATPHASPDTFPKKVTNKVIQVTSAVKNIWEGFKGIGEPRKVIVTWYTGHDLLNPSCWRDPVWAPTDNSFACAITQEGWTSKPKCFSFLELCNGPQKCVFVRVVDSCAGCRAGTKHVDLTKAAFSEIADLDKGMLTVEMRPATMPLQWFNELWGPKV